MGGGRGGGGRGRREGDRDSFPDLSAQLPLEAGGQLHTVNSPTYHLNCSLVSHFHSKRNSIAGKNLRYTFWSSLVYPILALYHRCRLPGRCVYILITDNEGCLILSNKHFIGSVLYLEL